MSRRVEPKSLRPLEFLPLVPKLMHDRAEAFRAIASAHGDVVRVPVPGKPFLLLSSPRHVQQVLQTRHARYRRSFDWRIVHSLVGDGPITSHGEVWKSGRRAAQPTLSRNHLARQAESILTEAEAEISTWDPALPHEHAAFKRMSRLSLRVFLRALFGIDDAASIDVVLTAFEACLEHLDQRLSALVDLAALFSTPGRVRFERARAIIHSAIDGWVRARRAQIAAGHRPADMLTALIEASEALPTGAPFPARESWLRDQIVTYVVAGHETSAVALSWSLHLLAHHPEIQARLHAELRDVTAGDMPRFEDLPRLTYTRQVVQEVIRLYPPVWAIGREAAEDDELETAGGLVAVPKGSTVVISPYVIHRKPELWGDDQDRFVPERFSTGGERAALPFAYFPFSSGPRYCPGERFATLEVQLLLAAIVRRFALEPAPGTRSLPALEARISLRPKGDPPVRFRPRPRAPAERRDAVRGVRCPHERQLQT